VDVQLLRLPGEQGGADDRFGRVNQTRRAPAEYGVAGALPDAVDHLDVVEVATGPVRP
jgi:hypothetical protein